MKKRESLVQSDNDSLKSLLPETDSGYYFEAPADDKGFKIKLRWRENKKLCGYVFERLGKRELATLRKGTHGEQRNDLADRILGELRSVGRHDLAARIKVNAEDDSEHLRRDQAVA